MTVGSTVRPLLLNVPRNGSEGVLANGGVIGYHGWHSNPWYYDYLSNLTNLTEAYGMALALPFGTAPGESSFYCCPSNISLSECERGLSLDPVAPCGWKTSDRKMRQFRNVDDVAYTKAIAKLLVDDVCVDGEKIFATGLSAGGAMTAKAACESDVLAGVAMMSGSLECEPTKPLAFLEFCGTLDSACNTSSYTTYDTWSRLNRCSRSSHPTYESATTSCRIADKCREPCTFVEQCMISGLGDAIPGHDRSAPIVPGTTYIPQAPTNIDSVKYAFDRWSTLFSSSKKITKFTTTFSMLGDDPTIYN